MSELRLTLLGQTAIHKDGAPVTGFKSNKAVATLCYVAVSGQPVARTTLVGLLWSELSEANAQMNLRHVIANLRELVGEYLAITRQTVALAQESRYWLDVEHFASRVTSGNPAEVSSALALYQGDFLAGLEVRQAPLFEEWVSTQRTRLRDLAVQAWQQLADQAENAGDTAAALVHLRRLLALEPWREPAHRQIMRLLAHSGQVNAALAQYQRPGDEPALEHFLLPRLDSSMFLLGNMRSAGLHNSGAPLAGAYAAALEANEIVGVVAHYGQGSLVCQAPVHLDLLWRAAVKHSKRAIMRVIGPAAQVAAIEHTLAVEPANVQMDEHEGLYSLALEEMREPLALRSGQVRGRRMTTQDIGLVTAWRVDYALESRGAVDSPTLYENCRNQVERALQDGTIWVLEEAGQLVACSGFNTTIAEAVQIGGVWTPPAARGRGYGRAVVAASLRDARAAGVTRAILFTGETNIPAQKAYLALGFRRVGDYRLLLFHRPVTRGE
jgi:DNA-binding SARP family transcriptional activator/predicted GNAT family acetyltransferase